MPRATLAQLFDLTGKTAIVTGAGTGLGEAIALRLAEAGAAVLIPDIDLQGACRTAEKIKSAGGKAHAMHADASSLSDAKKVVETALELYKSLDILVNNAGIYNNVPALEMTEEVWDKLLDLDLKGVFFFSQAAAKAMISAGNGGRIIHIASMAALHPAAGMPHDDAAKAGVNVLAKSLAVEFACHNILVNAVIPGVFATPGVEAIASAAGQTADQFLFQVLGGQQRFPLRRAGRPDDIARTVLFLASDMAEYITGTSIVVDGGFLLS